MAVQLPPTLEELINDPEGNRAKQQILAVVRGLERDGIKPSAICRALARTLMALCLEQYDKWGPHRCWAKKYLRDVGHRFQEEAEGIHRAETLVWAQNKLLSGNPSGSA